MRTLRLALLGSLLTLPATALAESPQQTSIEEYTPQVEGWMVAERPNGIQTVRQVLPSTGVIAHAGEVILYMNRAGTTLQPGNNDARTNRSTLVGQTTAIPAWSTATSPAWQQIMSCTRTMWAPYNVIVTDVDPGNVPHYESIVTTQPGVIGMDQGVGGVSPYTIGCDVIPNSIVFTFADAFGGDPETICEVVGQETAHSFGLDHQLLASDPMTYLQYNGLQSFKDQTVSCGEFQQRACGLQGECGANQNSHQMLIARIGPGGGGDGSLPTASITSPSNGATVSPGFTVSVSAADTDGTVSRVELWIDGTLADTKTSAPYSFTTSSSLSLGSHSIQTIAYDDAGGASVPTEITVNIAQGGGGGGGGDGDGDGDGDGNGGGDGEPEDLVGGCQAAGGGAAGSLGLLGIALVGLLRRRRR